MHKSSSKHVQFTSQEEILIQSKRGLQNQLTFATTLKFFECYGRFPTQLDPELLQIMNGVAKCLQIDMEFHTTLNNKWDTRSSEGSVIF
jgi:hypothetical protein